MKELFDRYFYNKDIPESVRLFYLVSLLSSSFSLLFALAGMILRVESFVIIICFLISFLCLSLFYFKRKYPEKKFFTNILLITCNYFAFPAALIFSKKNFVEIPVYFIIGITFGLVMYKKHRRIIYTCVLLVIDISCIIYTYYIRQPYEELYSLPTGSDYIRVGFAILSTGIICGTVINFRNSLLLDEITERKKAGLQAEQVSFAKDMFLVNISHEIITPLNAIIGTTDILLDSDVTPHIKEMASNISNSSHALLSITSDLLDFSRMNLDDVVINEEEYNISALLNDVINLMSVRLLDSNVSFYVNVNPGLKKTLIGDANKIRQIFVNLLSNAIKYTKEGSIIFEVDYDVLSEDTLNLKIRVLDTGIGIKHENLELIFEPRHRSGTLETDRSFEGNGLGLAYCRKICDAMHGRLWADSVFGEGSVFHFEAKQKFYKNDPNYCGTVNDMNIKVLYFLENGLENKALYDILESMNVRFERAVTGDDFIEKVSEDSFDYYMVGSATYEKIKENLYSGRIDFKKIVVISACNYSYSGEPFEYVLTTPLSCLNVSDLLNKTSNYSVRRKSFQGSFEIPDVTVLVIDDNLVNLGVAKEMIQRYGARILTAASGREGLICLKQETIDIVFLDYMMPDMDGIDTLKKIREADDIGNPILPVVALTANVVSGAREMFINAGFDDYLPKPIISDQLERTFIKLLPADRIKVKVDKA